MAFRVSRHGYLVWIPVLESFALKLRWEGQPDVTVLDAAAHVRRTEMVMEDLARRPGREVRE